jgi:hypothetical protein
MSHADGSTFGWPLWGAILLVIPIAFVIGALSGHPPTLGLRQNRVVLLGSLSVAVLGTPYPTRLEQGCTDTSGTRRKLG